MCVALQTNVTTVFGCNGDVLPS